MVYLSIRKQNKQPKPLLLSLRDTGLRSTFGKSNTKVEIENMAFNAPALATPARCTADFSLIPVGLQSVSILVPSRKLSLYLSMDSRGRQTDE